MVERLDIIARKNMETRFRDNPCRGIALGVNDAGKLVHVSWIMGRSKGSQNRRYVVDKEGYSMRTETADGSVPENKDLILYTAMETFDRDCHVVSNGNQTDTIVAKMDCPPVAGSFLYASEFFEALDTRYCEPDPANFTARISGIQHESQLKKVLMSVIQADPFARDHWMETQAKSGLKQSDFPNADAYSDEIDKLAGLNRHKFPSIRDRFERQVKPGYGYCITTYVTGSKELPPFNTMPFEVPLVGGIQDIMQGFWNALEPEWRVAVGGKICEAGKVYIAEPINKHVRPRGE